MERFYHLNNLQKYAKNPFVSYRIEEGDTLYSYEDILVSVQYVISEFQKEQLQRGCCIIKLAEHSPASIVLLLSILNYGCYFHPLDSKVDAKGIEDACKRDATTFVTDDNEIHSQLNRTFFKIKLYCWTFYVYKIIEEKQIIIPNWKDDLCYVIGTTGSTGKPKLVHVPYNCIAPNVRELCKRLNITTESVIFLCAPLTFDPFIIEFFMALYRGATLIITSSQIRLAPDKLLKVLFYPINGKFRVTVLQMTPFLFRLFGDRVIRDTILAETSPLRILLLGGEKFPCVTELCSWIAKPGDIGRNKRIFNIYGITEVSCWSTFYEVKPSDLMENDRLGIPLGEPIDNVTSLRIENLDGYSENQGELFIGSRVRKCFISDDNKSHEESAQDIIFRGTGDLVEQGINGEIFYIGRVNRTVKRYGKRVCLDMLEKDVQSLLQDQMLSPFFFWDVDLQKLICCLTATDKNFDKMAVTTLIMSSLDDFKKPDEIVFISKVPLNQHGKVDYGSLLKTFKKSKLISKPVEIFKKFLTQILGIQVDEINDLEWHNPPKKIPKNNMNSSFMDLGGTSFQALSLSTEIGGLLSPTNQRQLLEMFLDTNVTIAMIIQFLKTADVNVSSSEIRIANVELGKFKFHWKVNLDKCIDARVTLLDEKYICIGSHSHLLLTLDVSTGEVISRIKLPDRIECQVENLLNGSACVGCYDGHLYVFNYLNGQILRKINVGDMIKAKPLKLSDTLLIGSYANDSNLKCFCCKTFEELWSIKFGTKPIYANPMILNDETALICCLDGSYGAINIGDGKLVWNGKFSSPIFSTPALISVANGADKVVIAEVSGKVHICCALLGTSIDHYNTDGNIFSSILVDQQNTQKCHILFGCHDSHIYCLEYETHKCFNDTQLIKLLWKVCLQSPIYAMPILILKESDPVVVACSTKGLLIMLDFRSGKLVASQQLQGEIYSTPTSLDNGRISFGCRDNFVYCFGLE